MQPTDKNANNKERYDIFALIGLTTAKRIWQSIIILALTFLIFYFIFRKVNFGQTMLLLEQTSWHLWTMATLLIFSCPCISGIRWHLILRSMGFRIGVFRCIFIIVGLWPISTISPARSGDLLKAFCLRKEIKPMVVAGSVLSERILDLISLSMFSLVGGILLHIPLIIYLSVALLVLLVVAVVFIKFFMTRYVPPKLREKINWLFLSLQELLHHPAYSLYVVLLTATNWIVSFLMVWIFFRSVDAVVPFGATVTIFPVAILVGLLPFTIAGMGTRDSAMVYLFAAYATPSQAVAAALLYSFFGYWLLAVVGLPFMKKALHIK